VSAPETREQVAHGETVGLVVEKIKPRQGRQKTGVKRFFRPVPGLGRFAVVSPWAAIGRCSAPTNGF